MVGETGIAKGSRMMRKVSLVLLGAFMGAAVVTVGTQTRLLSDGMARAAASDTYRNLNLFGDVFEKIRSDYVEKPDEQKLVEAAINGMLTSLDPHSSYMDAKSFQDMQVQTRGEFGGLGLPTVGHTWVEKTWETSDEHVGRCPRIGEGGDEGRLRRRQRHPRAHRQRPEDGGRGQGGRDPAHR